MDLADQLCGVERRKKTTVLEAIKCMLGFYRNSDRIANLGWLGL
jgi:hypothetical protein